MIPNYDTWKLANAEDSLKEIAVERCETCGEKLFVGQEVIDSDYGYFCDKTCFIERVLEDVRLIELKPEVD